MSVTGEGTLIDVFLQDAAAFALYKHEHPESIAESWETVGLPVVLEYRKKANVVLFAYLTHTPWHPHPTTCTTYREVQQ